MKAPNRRRNEKPFRPSVRQFRETLAKEIRKKGVSGRAIHLLQRVSHFQRIMKTIPARKRKYDFFENKMKREITTDVPYFGKNYN